MNAASTPPYLIREHDTASFSVELPDAAATEAFGGMLSLFLKPGDVVTFDGDLGTGKTTMARAIVRALADDPELDVPSPTFTLVQTYESRRGEIVHVDLYRVEQPDEIWELGLDDYARSAVMLIEWPDRLEGGHVDPVLSVQLSEIQAGGRKARIVAGAAFAERLGRLLQSETFLKHNGWGGSTRRYFQGDASSRRYERLDGGGGRGVFMDMPRQPDGPPVRNGLPYSAIAHLAEGVTPFVAIAQILINAGLSAPVIRARDLESGFLITEDFGDAVYGALIRDGEPVDEPYRAAVDALLTLHASDLPSEVTVDDGLDYAIPHYDTNALMIEAGLVVDWFWPQVHGKEITSQERNRFEAVWMPLIESVAVTDEADEGTLVLRDYHSPNLMWLPDRDGPSRAGLLDFQDAVIGHKAYDLMSLLQDARTDISEEFECTWLDYYCNARRSRRDNFDEAAFRRAYAILGAQRATKILGIFVRLCVRDGKPQYLCHIPRVSGYLERNLAHHDLEDLQSWYDGHLPEVVRLSLSKIGDSP